jgi:hypothetical protein
MTTTTKFLSTYAGNQNDCKSAQVPKTTRIIPLQITLLVLEDVFKEELLVDRRVNVTLRSGAIRTASSTCAHAIE